MNNTNLKAMKLLQPIKVKNMLVKNRTVMPGMGTLFGNFDNTVSDRMKGYIKARAKGGTGLIIVEYTAVNPGGRAAVMQLGIWDDRFIKGLKELTDIPHTYGAKIGIQLHHAGRGTTTAKCGRQPVAPSAVVGASGEIPRELTVVEIKDLIDDFARAAVRTKKAGFDCVEIHGAHGYLISQFMSPVSNLRVDEYGGSFEGRLKFPVEVIKSVRRAVGEDYPVFFRISAEDMVKGGRTIKDTVKEAPILVAAGVDVLDVSIGMLESANWIITPGAPEFGFNADNTEEVKKVVDVPVIAVGKIHSPEIAEKIIAEGKADMVALGRALIVDPEFVNKVADGNWQDVRRCIHCLNGCYSEPVNCTQNPDLGHEWEYKYTPTGLEKNVVVIGGGPGGLEAAVTAAKRGHKVALFDKDICLGGQIKSASKPPHKEDFNNVIEYRKRQAMGLGVNLIINKEINVDDLKKMDVDVIILATGAKPIIPPIKGLKSAKVVNFDDVLQDRVVLGENIAVVGGGSVGAETADYLVDLGKKVTVIEMLDSIAADVPFGVRVVLMKELSEKANLMTNTVVKEISGDKLILEDRDGEKELVGMDQIVMAIGSKSNNKIYDDIREQMPDIELYMLGDACKVRKIIHAIAEGNRIGRLV